MFRNLSIIAASFVAGCFPVVEKPGPLTGPGDLNVKNDAMPATMTLATYKRSDARVGGVVGSFGARLTGRLAERDGCLVLSVEGGTVYQPVFPVDRVRLDSSSGRLFIADITYVLGDQITVTGGVVSNRGGFAETNGTSIPQCGGAELFVVSL